MGVVIQDKGGIDEHLPSQGVCQGYVEKENDREKKNGERDKSCDLLEAFVPSLCCHVKKPAAPDSPPRQRWFGEGL